MYSWAALSSSKFRSKQPSPEHLQGRADTHVSRAIETEGCFLRMQLALHARLWQQKEAGQAATPFASGAGADTTCMRPFTLFGMAVKLPASTVLWAKSASRQRVSTSCRSSPRCPAWPSPPDCPPHTLCLCTAPAFLHGTEHAAVVQGFYTLQLPGSRRCSRLHARAQHVAVPDRGQRQQRRALVTSCHTPT